MKSQGIDIDVDVTPSTPVGGDHDEESGPGIEEESEEEDFTDDDSIQAYINSGYGEYVDMFFGFLDW